MTWKNTQNHYGSLSIKMHWLMVVLMIFVFASIEGRVFFEKGTELRDLFKMWHFMLGLSVFILVCARLYLRSVQVIPQITPPLSVIQARGAHMAHLVLYVFMIAMPIFGWFVLSAKGKVIPFFGLELPALIPYDKPFGKVLEGWHKEIGSWGYYLIAFHAVAALVHHYIQKDDTLTRMLPVKKNH
ncbi:cytochrome b [Colwellia sp. Bg11-28]|uniref:cytochrome b n=1 Tax=Colwellia sp. Bg11-28 TaxID=2058305 RepID=UPI000C329D92|nr:cytochrome b [Colwellia sp. Bg11-28]PKH85099.1 cytochrome B [Colwellia sp. Bg11-28]